MIRLACVGVAFGLLGSSCGTESTFTCASDDQCARGAEAGRCEASGYCSFEDTACPSGRRYGDHAAQGLAGVCAPEDPDDTSTQSSGEDAPSSLDATTPAPSTGDEPGTTLLLDDGGSSTALSDGSQSEAGSQSDDGSAATTSDGGSTDEGGSSTDTGATSCPTFHDDFEDGAIDPQWTFWLEEAVSEAGGEIRFTIDPPEGNYGAIVWSQPFDLQQGWARVEIGTTPASYAEQLYLALFPVGAPAAAVMLLEGDLLLARQDGPGGFVDHAEVTLDPEVHVWVQLRGEGGQIHFETSPDGVDFQPLVSIDAFIDMSAVEVALVGGNWADIPAPSLVSIRDVQVCATP